MASIDACSLRYVVIKTLINRMTFDGATRDPMQKAVRDALIAFMAAMAEAAGRSDARGAEGRHWPRYGH